MKTPEKDFTLLQTSQLHYFTQSIHQRFSKNYIMLHEGNT